MDKFFGGSMKCEYCNDSSCHQQLCHQNKIHLPYETTANTLIREGECSILSHRILWICSWCSIHICLRWWWALTKRWSVRWCHKSTIRWRANWLPRGLGVCWIRGLLWITTRIKRCSCSLSFVRILVWIVSCLCWLPSRHDEVIQELSALNAIFWSWP